MKDYHYILGVDKDASFEEIKTAYKKLSKKFHPDMNSGDKFFEERFKEIQQAYEELSKTYSKYETTDRASTTKFGGTEPELVQKSSNHNDKRKRRSIPFKLFGLIFTVLVLVFLLIRFLTNTVTNCKVTDGNVFIERRYGDKKQITFTGKDIECLCVAKRNEIVAIRGTGDIGIAEYEGVESQKIVSIDLSSLKEKQLTNKFKAKDWGTELDYYWISHLQIDSRNKNILFLTRKWTTSDVLLSLNLETLRIKEISHADYFEIYNTQDCHDCLIVNRSEIKDNAGRDWSYQLLDSKGELLKELGAEDDMKQYKYQTLE